ncbi:hypothetical protein PYCC9005_003132 [Savitreella phatthalungensis]
MNTSQPLRQIANACLHAPLLSWPPKADALAGIDTYMAALTSSQVIKKRSLTSKHSKLVMSIADALDREDAKTAKLAYAQFLPVNNNFVTEALQHALSAVLQLLHFKVADDPLQKENRRLKDRVEDLEAQLKAVKLIFSACSDTGQGDRVPLQEGDEIVDDDSKASFLIAAAGSSIDTKSKTIVLRRPHGKSTKDLLDKINACERSEAVDRQLGRIIRDWYVDGVELDIPPYQSDCAAKRSEPPTSDTFPVSTHAMSTSTTHVVTANDIHRLETWFRDAQRRRTAIIKRQQLIIDDLKADIERQSVKRRKLRRRLHDLELCCVEADFGDPDHPTQVYNPGGGERQNSAIRSLLEEVHRLRQKLAKARTHPSENMNVDSDGESSAEAWLRKQLAAHDASMKVMQDKVEDLTDQLTERKLVCKRLEQDNQTLSRQGGADMAAVGDMIQSIFKELLETMPRELMNQGLANMLNSVKDITVERSGEHTDIKLTAMSDFAASSDDDFEKLQDDLDKAIGFARESSILVRQTGEIVEGMSRLLEASETEVVLTANAYTVALERVLVYAARLMGKLGRCQPMYTLLNVKTTAAERRAAGVMHDDLHALLDHPPLTLDPQAQADWSFLCNDPNWNLMHDLMIRPTPDASAVETLRTILSLKSTNKQGKTTIKQTLCDFALRARNLSDRMADFLVSNPPNLSL